MSEEKTQEEKPAKKPEPEFATLAKGKDNVDIECAGSLWYNDVNRNIPVTLAIKCPRPTLNLDANMLALVNAGSFTIRTVDIDNDEEGYLIVTRANGGDLKPKVDENGFITTQEWKMPYAGATDAGTPFKLLFESEDTVPGRI